ncbi:MAG: Flp pilus assembly protein CpaB [Solirubrobacteraceae bacterium]
MFSTRRGAITTAVVAALLAAVLLFAFVQSYQKGSSATAVNTPVFVASGYIPKGTPVSVIGSAQLLSRTTVPASKAVVGAITDPSVISGEVAASNIYPGQQLAASDFTAANVTVASLLTGNQRAIAIPLDSAHGLVGVVQTGDRVDVLVDGASATSTKGVVTLDQNILVLAAPSSGGGGGIAGGGSSSGNIILRVTNAQAPALAYAADNQKVWITLRPALDVGALTPSKGTSH